MWKCPFLRCPFFLPFLVPSWERFGSLFRDPKILFFFQKLAKIDASKWAPSPFIRHFLLSTPRTSKRCPKGLQNTPKMLPNLSPRGLQMCFLQCLRAPAGIKKICKSFFLRCPFFLPFSVPSWERFGSLFRVPKFPFFFQKLAKIHETKWSTLSF